MGVKRCQTWNGCWHLVTIKWDLRWGMKTPFWLMHRYYTILYVRFVSICMLIPEMRTSPCHHLHSHPGYFGVNVHSTPFESPTVSLRIGPHGAPRAAEQQRKSFSSGTSGWMWLICHVISCTNWIVCNFVTEQRIAPRSCFVKRPVPRKSGFLGLSWCFCSRFMRLWQHSLCQSVTICQDGRQDGSRMPQTTRGPFGTPFLTLVEIWKWNRNTW